MSTEVSRTARNKEGKMTERTFPAVHEHDWSAPVWDAESVPRRWLRWCESPACQMPDGSRRTLGVTATEEFPGEWEEYYFTAPAT